MLVGKGTVAGLPEKDRNIDVHLRALRDTASTILLVEAPNSGIPWAEPRDLTVDEFIERLKSHEGLNHRGRVQCGLLRRPARCSCATSFPRHVPRLANPNRDGPIDESHCY